MATSTHGTRSCILCDVNKVCIYQNDGVKEQQTNNIDKNNTLLTTLFT